MKNKKFLDLLKEKGLKNQRLADKLNVSVRSVEHWINGRNRPSIPYVIAMAKLFNMSVESVYKIFKEGGKA